MLLKNFVRKLIIPTAGIIVTMPVMLGATEVTFAQTNGKTAEEAVAWVQSYEGQGIDYDGSYGNQCVDLIKAYYDYLGETPVRGNADTYAYNALPEGWQRIQGAAVVGALLADFTQICSSDASLLSRPLKIVGDASLYDIDIYATHNSSTDFWCKH